MAVLLPGFAVKKTRRGGGASMIDESVDVTSLHYWFAIHKAFALFLLTTIYMFKVDFSVFCSICLKSGNTKLR